MDSRQCYEAFGCEPTDKLIIIKEQHLADSNFVFGYLLKQALYEHHHQVVLVLTHNTQAHYECIAKKIGYNLAKAIEAHIVEVVSLNDYIRGLFLSKDMSVSCSDVLNHMQELIKESIFKSNAKNATKRKCFVFIDDFSHVQELLGSVDESINYLNSLLSFYNDANIAYVVGLHIGDKENQVVSRDLEYSADCIVDISLIKTGHSNDISGVLKVVRNRKLKVYHYKLKEYGVEIIPHGSFLMH